MAGRECNFPLCPNDAMWCGWCAKHCSGDENHSLHPDYNDEYDKLMETDDVKVYGDDSSPDSS